MLRCWWFSLFLMPPIAIFCGRTFIPENEGDGSATRLEFSVPGLDGALSCLF